MNKYKLPTNKQFTAYILKVYNISMVAYEFFLMVAYEFKANNKSTLYQ